jgi:hypothetical protein
MADKWQQISLKLDTRLAQGLRDMKQGHDESVAEVVLRLLRKAVRQSHAGDHDAPTGRSNPRAAGGRGAVRAGGKGKPPRPAGRAGSGGAAPGKPWAAPAAAAGSAEGGQRKRPWVAAPPGASRRIAGKAPRTQALDGASEPRRRNARAGAAGPRSMRPSDAQGAAEERPKRPRPAKKRRSVGR